MSHNKYVCIFCGSDDWKSYPIYIWRKLAACIKCENCGSEYEVSQ